ncbi:MAG: hypothetical protein KAT76_03785 [Bacteroidales bacterium]|nr:hypothetical protein [Bacteroidales bacterium]
MLFILFPVLLLQFPGSSHAQMIREVHKNKNDYLLDITAILQYTSNKDYLASGEELLGSFAGVWESGYFKPHHREKIYELSNTMLNKSMRSYPNFFDFIGILTSFVEKGLDDNSLELWLSELDTLGTQRSSRPMADFLEYTKNLLGNSMLYETRSRAWYFRNGNISFAYDSLLYLDFPELDLICSTGRDSTVILQTSGKYYLSTEFFYGRDGKISWRRAGFKEDDVFANLKTFNVDFKTLSFISDSAVLYNKTYFNFPIPGVLIEKVFSSSPGDRASYPQFESYFKDYELLGLYDNVNYIGGLGMQGRKVIFTGGGDLPAKFIFKKGGDYFAVIRSRTFELEDDEIVSSPASFSIYFDKDSIYHPGLQMRYDNKNKLLSLVRLNRGIAQSPFFDAYHEVDMYCEALYWVMNSDEISFEMVRGISQDSKTSFESDRYYSASAYYRLQGIDEVNPLLLVKKYADRYSSNIVKVGAFAGFIKKPVEQAVSMLLLLDSRGFVVYSSDKREALIKQRLYDYLKAHHGKTDYDVIRFTSETNNKSNAVVELATFDMLISGVPEISLSDSQMVYIYPVNEEIVLKEDKDFSFSGRIRAGLFEFYAHECSFEYDTFKINMPQIDSMSFFVRVPDTSGKEKSPRYYRVQAMVEDMNGYMMIDNPNNKSGLKSYPQYPIFTSTDYSFVYYDGNTKANGTFDRGKFYYELDPFTLDSLDNFSTTGMCFQGYLASGGILPPIRDPLRVMPDYSLGLKSITEEDGLPLYDGKAIFYDTIIVDNSGLHGAGKLQYLTSLTEASDIVFYADSVFSTTTSFMIESLLDNVEYADVSVGKAYQSWYPDSNLMVVEIAEEAFNMYDSTAKFRGNMFLTPEALNGSGDFTFERAVIESDNFVFGHHSMWADTSDFSLYTDTTFSTLAFFTNDYRTDLDFDQRKGKFISTGISSLVDIPFNKFICYMDEIEWEMDRQNMHLKNNIVEDIPDINDMTMLELIDLNLAGSEFISTRPDQDSLRFFGTSANYNMQKNIIYAEDVKIIRVADAAIFPGDGKLNILQDAQIETLRYADIITDTASRLHHIYNANVNIFSRHHYIASGDIDYLDVMGESSPVYLSSITVDSLGRTYASGNISDTSAFMLSPWYSFVGNIKLEAMQEFLQFNGSFSIWQDCFDDFFDRALIDTLINPDNILIPVPDSLKGPEGGRIMTSIMYTPKADRFYPAFFTEKLREGDISVLSATGLLSYDANNESFMVSADNGGDLREYLALHNDNCVLEGVGDISLGMELPHVELDLYGHAGHYIIPDSTRFEIVMGFDFFFDPNVLRRLSKSLSLANLPGTETTDAGFLTFLKQRMPSGEADKIIADLSNFGIIRKLPESIKYTLLLNQVKFHWNRATSSLVSYGDIGVFSVGDEVVNRMVPGYVEIERKASGYGVVNIYFEIPEGDWYFFSYRNYILQAISSDEGFNNEILNLKEDKRIIYSRDEDVPYEFVISSRRKMIDFKRKMEEIYGRSPR